MKLLGLAGTIAVAVTLIGTAGAGAKPVSVKRLDLSTRAAVAKYLHSIGVNPKGVVIQRGRFNYAGPNCPGQKWTCTTAKRVVQVAADDHGENSFQCSQSTPPYGTTANPPGECIIVQISTKKNKATCREHIQTSSPSADEHCSIQQTGPNNESKVDMLIVMHGSPDQSATQNSDVSQQNYGTTKGHNDSDLRMRIVQTTGPSYSSGTDSSTQTQETSQNATVDQFDQNAGTNDSDASSSFHQIARAAADTTTQTQNTSPGTDNNVDVLQDNNGGKNDSDLDISGRSVAIAGHGHDNGSNRHASAADTALHQTQGSETGGLAGSTNQHSNIGEIDSAPRTQSAPQAQTGGRSTLDATIHEDMLAFGPPTAVQEQHGPTACCSFQTGGGTQDHEHIRELINLFTSNGNPIQTDLNLLDCHSDNPTGCDGRIRANLNGNVGTVSCAGNVSPCDIGLVCSSVESEGACVPTPCIDTGEGCFVPPPCYPTCISASPSHKSSQARRE